MDEALALIEYLPLSFKSPKEQAYIAFLWDAFETNYVHSKYQFAFLAYGGGPQNLDNVLSSKSS